MRELAERAIDEKSYAFEQFDTTTALKTLTKLTRIFGEPLTIGLGAFFKTAGAAKKAATLTPDGVPAPVADGETTPKKSLLDTDLDANLLAKAVKVLVERMDEDEVVSLVKKLTTEGVLCDGMKIVSFNEHFRGELPHLFKVLAAALEVQYGNFIGVVTAQVPAGLRMTMPISGAMQAR